jgi:hypothetical protein
LLILRFLMHQYAPLRMRNVITVKGTVTNQKSCVLSINRQFYSKRAKRSGTVYGFWLRLTQLLMFSLYSPYKSSRNMGTHFSLVQFQNSRLMITKLRS